MHRSHNLGEVNEGLIGEEVTLAGWVDTIRDHNNVLFVDGMVVSGAGGLYPRLL